MYKSGKVIKINKKKINFCEFDCAFTMTDAAGIFNRQINPLVPHIIRVNEMNLIGGPAEYDISTVNTNGNAQSMFNYTIYDRIWRAYNGYKNFITEIISPKITFEYKSIIYQSIVSKLKVIQNRLYTETDYDCIICMEPIHPIGSCIVSTCCFTLFCEKCILSYQRTQINNRNSIMIIDGTLIKLNAPCCGIYAWSPKYSNIKHQTKIEKLKAILHAYDGANIVIYAPLANYDLLATYINRPSRDISTLCCVDPFITRPSSIVFINNNSIICKNINWQSLSLFIDCSNYNLLDSKQSVILKSVILNIISKSFLYIKLNYNV